MCTLSPVDDQNNPGQEVEDLVRVVAMSILLPVVAEITMETQKGVL